MAIKRIDTKARFKLICEHDSALVRETAEELAELTKTKTPTRYERYSETLDESLLKFKDGEKPDYFQIRCLLNDELAELHQSHMVVDTVNKTVLPKNGSKFFMEVFDLACDGIFKADGSLEKVNREGVGFAVALSIGATIYTFTELGKHLKK